MEVRKSVVPSKGKKFFFMDWKAAELYAAAVMAGCGAIIDPYKEGKDIHTAVAAKFFSKEESEVTKEERETTKVIEFSALFGSEGGAAARRLQISFDEGAELVHQFFNRFPELKEYRSRVHNYAIKHSSTNTMMGRRRILKEMFDERTQAKALRQSFNTAIQGTVADFFKKAIVKAGSQDKFKFRVGVFPIAFCLKQTKV